MMFIVALVGLLTILGAVTTQDPPALLDFPFFPEPVEIADDTPVRPILKTGAPQPPTTTETPKPIAYGDTYIVAVPRCIRTGLSADVYVDIVRRVKDGVNVRVELINKTNNHVFAFGEKHIDSGLPQTISIMVPSDLTYRQWNDRFYVRITGTGPEVNFQNGTFVNLLQQNATGFLQTDKAIYKPGQIVQYRIFALHPDLKTYKATYDIEIRDGNGNRIRNEKGMYDPSGLVKGELTLSYEPVFGMWTITAKTQGATIYKSFQVKEYVLPRIEVTVAPPPFIALSQNTVDVTVTAKYTFGKKVKGKLTVTAKINPWWSSDRTKKQLSLVRQLDEFNGEHTFSFTMADIKTLHEYYTWYRFEVEATLTETLTGKVASGKGSSSIHKDAEKVEFLQSASTCKPGLSYTAYIKVSQQDGTPVVGQGEKLRVQINKTYYIYTPRPTTTKPTSAKPPPPKPTKPSNPESPIPLRDAKIISLESDGKPSIFWPFRWTKNIEVTYQEVHVPESGVVELKLLVVPGDAEYITINATYKHVSRYWTASKAYSPSDSFIQMDVVKELRKPGDTQKIKLKSNKPIDSFSIMVISRGRILMTREENKRLSTKHAFSFRITSEMAPRAKLVVYYRADNAEIVPDVVSFNVRDPFKNKVSIGFNAKEVRPGDDVTMTVQADPFSLVATLVLDKKVLLLKTGNDVTEEQVTNSLWSFDSCGYYGWWGWGRDDMIMEGGSPIAFKRRRRRRYVPWRYPYFSMGNDASSVFSSAGLIIITDSMLYRHNYFNERFPSKVDDTLAFPGVPEDGAPVRDRNEGGGAGNLQEVGELRTQFPETWLFLVDSTDANGQLNVATQAPDSITSWRATAFAFHDDSGFGISPQAGELTVVKPFFANLFVPYSVIRGEDVFIQVNVFNYLKSDQTVAVTLRGSDNFRFLDINDVGEEELIDGPRTLTVKVLTEEAKSVVFPIRAVTIGNIEITTTVQSSEASDGLTKTILVKAEGVPDEYNYAQLINLTSRDSYTSTSKIQYPADVVDGSQRLAFSLVGDVLGRTVENLANLVRMSYGCGEQNMVNFAPTVFVSQYLNNVGQLNKGKRTISVNYIDQGYQRQMRYKRTDGSFSGFGERDDEGSLWLTAFVAKSFSIAAQEGFIDIDDAVFKHAYAFIAKYQRKDGSFVSVGEVHSTRLQGQSGTGTRALTAYTLTALLENEQFRNNFPLVIERAIGFVEGYMGTTDDLYDLAIGTYALTLAGRASAAKALARLEEKATNEDGYTFWSVDIEPTYRWEPPRTRSQAATIETTSYVCLVYALIKDGDKGINCIAWLTSQQNDYGGFVSTQDTVVAVQALSALGGQHYTNTQSGSVTVEGGSKSHTFTVDNENRLEIQSVLLPVAADSVTVRASGRGTFLVSISAKYNVESGMTEPAFQVKIRLVEDTPTVVKLRFCATYTAGNTSNMATIDVHLPSGFGIDGDSKNELEKIAKRVDVLDGKVVLYFDQITDDGVCMKLTAESSGSVNKAQPCAVKVVDYYSPEKSGLAFYQMESLKGHWCNSPLCAKSGCSENCARRKKK